MSLYLVSYDLRSDNHDYGPLLEHLRALNEYKVLKSVWLVTHGVGTGRDFAATLWGFVQPDDSLLAIEVGKDSGWANLMVTDERINYLRTLTRF